MASPTVPRLLEFKTRFLFPFFFARGSVTTAAGVLQAAPLAGVGEAWTAARPPEAYRDELLGHVSAHLFPDPGCTPTCGYLRLSEKHSNRIFRGVLARFRKHPPMGVELARPAGCELFLTSQGVGVLSIALDFRPREPSPELAIDFNYMAARRHAGFGMTLEIPHASADEERWKAIAEEHRRQIPPAPPADAPMAQRLGAAGGSFTLYELAAEMLDPLRAVGLDLTRAGAHISQVPSLFTVARLDASVDFADADTRRELGPVLSALAQVEEPLHAGAVAEDLGVPTALLNRKHWAATGQLGSAHLAADQPPDESGKEPEFNHERVTRIFTKYFIPYLLALMQRLVLQRSMAEAARIVADGASPGATSELSALHAALLEFSVAGHFPQLSSRHVLHRYYQLAREGLDVPALWEEVRGAVADLDARNATQSQRQLTEGMAKSLQTGLDMQGAVHVIEIFLVTVYSAHLALMFLETLHPLVEQRETLKHLLELAGPFLVGGAALVGYLVTKRLVSHRAPEGHS
ncbi:MAG: hypothetical protein ACYC8T_25440 [Myxococcaceae bacterium]